MHDHLKAAVEFLRESPMLQGAFMSAIITFLRIAYDEKEEKWQRIVLEMALAACLTISAGSFVSWMGASQETILGVGGAVGWIGVSKIRAIAVRYLNNRTDAT